MKLSKRIKDLRTQANWTLADLSNKTGKSVSFLSDIEHDRSSPSIETLWSVAGAFDLSLVDLLTGVERDSSKPCLAESRFK